jgi:hypothetical protein
VNSTLEKITLEQLREHMSIAPMYPEGRAKLDLIERGEWDREMAFENTRQSRERTKEGIDRMLEREDVTGICIFENLDMWSSNLGSSSALCYGPGCTYKTIDDLKGQHLGDVPSRFKYPTKYYEKEQA